MAPSTAHPAHADRNTPKSLSVFSLSKKLYIVKIHIEMSKRIVAKRIIITPVTTAASEKVIVWMFEKVRHLTDLC